MTCPKCGAQLLAGSTFCGACGHRLAPAPAVNPGAEHSIQIDEDSRGRGRGYDYEVLHQPSFSLAVLRLQPEQSIQAESGAMVSMSANIELQSQMKGGFLGAIKRAAGGESAFISTFTARGGPGDLLRPHRAWRHAARATPGRHHRERQSILQIRRGGFRHSA